MHGDPDKGPAMLVMPRRHGFNRFRSVSWARSVSNETFWPSRKMSSSDACQAET
jgi:hypothetical protein